MKSQKGITLIALVITIIVMLILVAVTITMAINGGLFDYAGRASQETNNAIQKEQTLGNGTASVNMNGEDKEADINTLVDHYVNNTAVE